MKRLFAMLLVTVMTCCILSFATVAFAKNPVISPEKDNTEVAAPVPESPQTGGLPVCVFAAGAVLSGGVAVTAMKKVSSDEEKN